MDQGNSSVAAIIVPTARPASYTRHAIRLAGATHSFLLALCSKSSSASDVAAFGCGSSTSGIAIRLPPDYTHPLLDFNTSGHPEGRRRSDNDLSLKRNLGLLLALMVGWDKVLFLDDDIRGLTADRIACAATLISHRHCAVAFLAPDWPDNSVVRHAYRLSGEHYDVFPSGNCLIVNPRQMVGYFPNIYNEDWLFLYDLTVENRVAVAGTVKQLPYAPFVDPARAIEEEFGDALWEGLIALGRAGVAPFQATEDDWRRLLAGRRLVIQGTIDRLRQKARLGMPNAGLAVRALRAAENQLATVTAADIVDYVALWRGDVESWRERLARVRPTFSLPQALDFLGLTRHAYGLAGRAAEER